VPVSQLVRGPEPILRSGDGWLEAEVRTVDRFGNVQLAALGTALDALGPPRSRLRVGGLRAVRTTTFGEAPPGGLAVYVDSAGYVAVAVNGGDAVTALSATAGDVLRIER
jgi:S-adenosylmethionine hydrolase